MTDEMTAGPSPYPQPALRVSATYHASDGRVPEEIVLEFGGADPVEPELVDRAIRALAGVADQRSYTISPMPATANVLAAIRRAADAARIAAHEVDGVAQVAAGAFLAGPAQAEDVEAAA